MKSSKDLLREINYELTLPSSRKTSPVLRDNELRRTTEKFKGFTASQASRKSMSPFRRSCDFTENSRSEMLADQIIQKIRLGKDKFSQNCKSLISQIYQLLEEDKSFIYIED